MIVAIASSGRKNSNSTHLLKEALKAGAPKEEVRLVELASLDFRGCTGCGGCRKGAPGCVLRDELTLVLEAIATADAVVCASPNYYGYVSGIFKSFLDRFYGFRDADRALRLPEGRKLLFIMSQGHPDQGAYANVVQSLERIFTGYGFIPTTLVAAGMEAEGQVAEDEELLGKAGALGSSLFGA
jgi:multimeric flavodoxin WrbA